MLVFVVVSKHATKTIKETKDLRKSICCVIIMTAAMLIVMAAPVTVAHWFHWNDILASWCIPLMIYLIPFPLAMITCATLDPRYCLGTGGQLFFIVIFECLSIGISIFLAHHYGINANFFSVPTTWLDQLSIWSAICGPRESNSLGSFIFTIINALLLPPFRKWGQFGWELSLTPLGCSFFG